MPREPSLPYLSSGLPYLNPISQLDGTVDVDDEDDTFQSSAPAARMAATGAGAPEPHEVRPPDVPKPKWDGPPAGRPSPPPPPPLTVCAPPAVRLLFRIEDGDIHSLGVMGKWVRAHGGRNFTRAYFNNFKDFKDHKGAIWM